MSFFNPKAAVLVLAFIGGLTSFSVSQAAPATPAAAPQQIPLRTIALLNGKFKLRLPADYVVSAMPAGVPGTLYINQEERRMVVVVESTLDNGKKVADNDPVFLDQTVEDFMNHQAAQADYKKTSQQKITVNGLGIRQIDATSTMGGAPTLSTTLLAASGPRMLDLQIISAADDGAGHLALTKQITGVK